MFCCCVPACSSTIINIVTNQRINIYIYIYIYIMMIRQREYHSIIPFVFIILPIVLLNYNNYQNSVYGQETAVRKQQQKHQQQEESLLSSILLNNNLDENDTKKQQQQTNTNTNNRFKSHRWGVLLGSNDNTGNNDESSSKTSTSMDTTKTKTATSTSTTTDQLMNVIKQKAIKSMLSQTKAETVNDKATTTTTNSKTAKKSIFSSIPTVQAAFSTPGSASTTGNTMYPVVGWIVQRFVYNLLHPFEIPIYFQNHMVASATATAASVQRKPTIPIIFNNLILDPIRNFLSINPTWLNECIRTRTDTDSSPGGSSTGSSTTISSATIGSSLTGKKPFTVSSGSVDNIGKQQHQQQRVHPETPIIKQQQQGKQQTPILQKQKHKQKQIPKLQTQQQQQQQQQGKTVSAPPQSQSTTGTTSKIPILTTTIASVSVSNRIKQMVSNIQRVQSTIVQIVNNIPKTLINNILFSSIVLFVYVQIKNYFVIDLLQQKNISSTSTSINTRSIQYCIHLFTYILYIGQGLYLQNTFQKSVWDTNNSNGSSNFIQSALQTISNTIKNNNKVSNGYMLLIPVVAVIVPIIVTTILQSTFDILSGFLLTFSGQLLPGDTIQIPSSLSQKSIMSLSNQYVYENEQEEYDSISTVMSDDDDSSDSIVVEGDTTKKPYYNENEVEELLLSGIVQNIGLFKSHVRVVNDNNNSININYYNNPTTTSSSNTIGISNTILLQQVLSIQQQKRLEQKQKLSTSILHEQHHQQEHQNEEPPLKVQSIAPNDNSNKSTGQQQVQIIIQELYFPVEDSEKISNLCDSIIHEIRMTCPNIIVVAQQEDGDDDEQSIQANWIDISLDYLTVLVQVQFTLVQVAQVQQEQSNSNSNSKTTTINLEELQNKERVLKAINTAVRYHDMTYYNTNNNNKNSNKIR